MNGKIKKFGEKVEKFLSGKGFYIVLFLCVAAIGMSAWVLTYSGEGDELGAGLDVKNPVGGILDEDYDNIFGGNDPQYLEDDRDEVNDFVDVGTVEEEEPEAPVIAIPEEPVATVFMWPVTGEIEMPHSVGALVYDETMGDWRTHPGVDIAAAVGTKVLSVAAGTVDSVFSDQLMGTTVVISHGDGLLSVYSNLAEVPTVSLGDSVSLGGVIGSVGDTAIAETAAFTHLHFEMLQNGLQVDPMDYLPSLS